MKIKLPPLAEKLRPVSDIPNTVGFCLTLVKGTAEIACTVQKDANGCHICVDLRGSYRNCNAFDGWRARR
jgi:hypothetical protein